MTASVKYCKKCGMGPGSYNTCGQSECPMNASSDDYVPRSALTGDSAPGDSVATTLAERNKTHGDFTDNAAVMQATKNLWRSTRNWHTGLTSVQREALDMIAHKVGRILTGNPNEKDHWHDIAGYAKLSEDRCK